jgi:YidC/Oxa1 family membrane protein insertase
LGAIGGLYNSVYQGLGEIMKPLLLELHTLLGMAGIANWGLTIIVFTLLVKLIFWPLTVQQIRASRAMQDLQPKLNDLKKMYGKDREKLMQEQMRLYKENSVNPTAGCLPLLIQFPIWIGLYGALNLLKTDGLLAGGFLWIPSLAQPEPFPHALAILTAASQWVVQRPAAEADAADDAVHAADVSLLLLQRLGWSGPLLGRLERLHHDSAVLLHGLGFDIFLEDGARRRDGRALPSRPGRRHAGRR